MSILLFVIKRQLRKLIILSFAIILYLFVTSSKMWQKLKSEVPRPKKHFQFSSKDYKFILTWSEAYGGLTYGLSEGFAGFTGCPEPRCYLTSDRNLLGAGAVEMFDAILFHQRSLTLRDLPDKRKRRPEQRYVHWSFEAPVYSFHDLTDLKYLSNFFNWSMSYRQDAEFPVPYGAIEKVSTWDTNLDKVIHSYGLRNQHLYHKPGRNTTKAPAAWLVSNCEDQSKRKLLVQKLKRHVGVDVFGSGNCSDLKCIGNNNECLNMINNTYLFYLALENSLCRDYITEKFWKVLPFDIIPVVLNGLNMSKIAPPHSYIDIKEFKSFSAFALHIQRVSRDPSLFASYFWWKDFYRIEPCNHKIICHKKLFDKASTSQNTYSTQKHDIKKWWSGPGTCKTFKKNFIETDQMWNLLPK